MNSYLVYIAIGSGLTLILVLLYPGLRYFRQNKIIRERTNEITRKNKIIEEQNKMLRQLDEEKNKVLSVVSHDLKAPLNRVHALTSLIMMDSKNLTKDQLELVGKISTVISDGLSFIKNMLDVRSIEHEGIDMNTEEIYPGSMLNQLIGSFQSTADRKEIELVFNDHLGKVPIDMDRHYFDRIFENIVSNALKFTKIGGKVTIDLEEEGAEIIISVTDEGPGIMEDEKERLFRKYEVLNSRPTSGESSYGLGLFIVKSLVNRLEGKVWVESKEGEGATFYVKLRKSM